jgi:polysaccharide pyruvyl transferase WcaK-like protein
MRFHSLVFALGLDVPAVAIDYTLGKGKVRSLAERFGVPFQSLADIKADFIVQEVNSLLQRPYLQASGFSPRFSEDVVSKLPLKMLRSK